MTKDQALALIDAYCEHLRREGCEDENLRGLATRWPGNGSEAKAMRWLGYMQGALQYSGRFELDDLKLHARLTGLGMVEVAALAMSRKTPSAMLHELLNAGAPEAVLRRVIERPRQAVRWRTG